MRSFIKVMKALSSPERVKIVKMLQHRFMCVCEIQTALGISQPAVSRHLRLLEEAGLVKHEKDGLWVNYSLTGGEDNPYAANMLGNLKYWLNNDPEVVYLMEKLPGCQREAICGK